MHHISGVKLVRGVRVGIGTIANGCIGKALLSTAGMCTVQSVQHLSEVQGIREQDKDCQVEPSRGMRLEVGWYTM